MTLNDLDIQWTQRGDELILNCIHGSYFFRMPDKWKLEKVSKNFLRLAEILIFAPFIEENGVMETIDQLRRSTEWEKRPSEGKVGLSFSGGVDSSAAAFLLPKEKTVLCYFKRSGFKSGLHHGNQLKCLDWFKNHGYEGYVIETDIERLRKNLKGPNGNHLAAGFLTDYVCALPVYLLADHLGLSYVTTGTPLDVIFMWKGYKYRDFTKSTHYISYTKLFEAAGLPIFWAVGGCSEIVTFNICEKNNIPAQSCLRRDEGECGKCYKCFRNSIYRNGEIHFSKPIKKILSKKPLQPCGAAVLAGLRNGGMLDLSEYLNVEVDFEYGYYSEAYEGGLNLPAEHKDKILDNIKNHVLPLTKKEVGMLKAYNLGSVDEI